jgi:hypothetical protein
MGCPASALASSLPVVIGEFPANGDRVHPPDHHPPALSLTAYLDLALDGGYLGAWPWSFKGVDAFGAVEGATMREWHARRILPPTI